MFLLIYVLDLVLTLKFTTKTLYQMGNTYLTFKFAGKRIASNGKKISAFTCNLRLNNLSNVTILQGLKKSRANQPSMVLRRDFTQKASFSARS